MLFNGSPQTQNQGWAKTNNGKATLKAQSVHHRRRNNGVGKLFAQKWRLNQGIVQDKYMGQVRTKSYKGHCSSILSVERGVSGSKVQCNQVKRGSAKGEITKCFVAPLIQLKTFPRAIIPTYAVHARPSTCNTITTQSLISEMISYHFIFSPSPQLRIFIEGNAFW